MSILTDFSQNCLLKSALILLVSLGFVATSCNKKDDDNKPSQTDHSVSIPETYASFQNIIQTPASIHIKMLDEFGTYMKTANKPNTALDAGKLQSMFSNTGNPFAASELNSSNTSLAQSAEQYDLSEYATWITKLAAASQSKTLGSSGKAGVVISKIDSTKRYLCDENGVEHIQWIEKGIFGSVFVKQALSNSMSEEAIGKYASQEQARKNWDNAFTYFGVPLDFPKTTTGLKSWGNYCNRRDPVIKCIDPIMKEGFLKGRAAIDAKKDQPKYEAVAKVRSEWERIIAATIINYINSAKKDFTDDAIRNHSLSECTAFIRNLRNIPNAKAQSSQIQKWLDTIGNNFYNVTLTNLEQVKTEVANLYGLTDVKDRL